MVHQKALFLYLINGCGSNKSALLQDAIPIKLGQWRCDHYWGEIAGRKDKWVLIDKFSKEHLLKLAWTPIRRHILVKGNASPDNPKLQEYWRKRQNRKLVFEVCKLLEPNAG